MKEIGQVLPFNFKEIKERHQDLYKKLKVAFKNPDVEKQIMKIRDKFKIPAFGMKCPGFSSKHSLDERKMRYRRFFLPFMALSHDDKKLKELRIKVRSKKTEYQKEITKLRKELKLPMRFQHDLAYSVVLHNKFPGISPCDSPCLIRIFDDDGEKRIMLEVFGDTKREHLLKAWKYLENLKGEYALKGNHLFRYSNYYADMSLNKRENSSLIKNGDVESVIGYDEIAIRKKRFRDFEKKHNYSK